MYDNIIIGGGISSLGVALGLQGSNQKTLLVTEEDAGFEMYDSGYNTPCAFHGLGGLGNYWHGVIPLPKTLVNDEDCLRLLKYFYSGITLPTDKDEWVLVPRKPIRPKVHFQKLDDELKIHTGRALNFNRKAGSWVVHTKSHKFITKKLWLSAGALGTNSLFKHSEGFERYAKKEVSDHVILYLGQICQTENKRLKQKVFYGKHGYFYKPYPLNTPESGLVSIKPARFDFKALDFGMSHRMAFGLPATSIIKRLFTAGSPGFISEALFNKFGWFPNASIFSVYSQVRVQNAHSIESNGVLSNQKKIENRVNHYMESIEDSSLIKSKMEASFLRGIHLHDSLEDAFYKEEERLKAEGLFVVDASKYPDIGHRHHSFRVMCDAYREARLSIDNE